MKMLFVSEAVYASIAGETAEGHGLSPRSLKAGGFALPLSVAFDKAHKNKWPVLKALPIQDIQHNDFADGEE